MSRPDDGALPGDPFWDVVQRRHPDVDIVILPPEPATVVDGPAQASMPDARRLARDVDEMFDEMWDLLLPAQPVVHSLVRWEAGIGTGVGAPARSARVDHLQPDEARLLVTAADGALTARTWRVTSPDGPFHRLTATADGITVTMSAHQDVCRLEVRGADVTVGRDALRSLRREAGA